MDHFLGSVVAALAAGAIAKLGDVGGKAVLDSYEALKKLVTERSKRGRAVEALEEDPHSESQRKVVEEALSQSVQEADGELNQAAAALTAELEKCPPSALEAIGLKLQSVEAMHLKFKRISVEGGGTGALLDKVRVSGTIEFDEISVKGPVRPN